MKNFFVESATALDDHHLRVRWTDGLEGVIDFSELMAKPFFAPLSDSRLFRDVRIEEYGHTIYWLTDDGAEIDICPDVLRAKLDPAVAAWIAEQERRWAARNAAE